MLKKITLVICLWIGVLISASAQIPVYDRLTLEDTQQAQVSQQPGRAKVTDRSVVLYQRFDWGSVVDYGSNWLPIAAYADENSCHTEVQKVTEAAAKDESKNSGAYLCQTARNDDEESFAKLLIAKRSN